MKKEFMLSLVLCLATICRASVYHADTDSTVIHGIMADNAVLRPLTPSYHKDVCEAANWGYNWFIEVKGGASAFLGTPLGCGDLNDRLKPAMQVGIGKWFTPAVGGRVEYQGFKFKNAEFKDMGYHFVHADFLYNLTGFINQNDKGISRWDVIPFLGVGMIYNPDWTSTCSCTGRASGTHPFAFSYGLECRYNINDRLHVIAEMSGMSTSKKFDAIGPSTKFGDHMMSLCAGLSVTLGKTGWKKVIDAKPYMEQNRLLQDYISQVDNDRQQIPHSASDSATSKYPRNDYSGLNSLRARLGYNNINDNSEMSSDYNKEVTNNCSNYTNNTDSNTEDSYISAMSSGKVAIGSPVYVFFKISTCNLTDISQILNIEEIAKVAKAHNLKIKVIGSADSATGSEKANDLLSHQRADYIRKLLTDRGVLSERITIQYEGGIDEYSPVQANRNTCVILSF